MFKFYCFNSLLFRLVRVIKFALIAIGLSFIIVFRNWFEFVININRRPSALCLIDGNTEQFEMQKYIV